MFIQTETTSNPATMKFLPGQAVLPSGTAEFTHAESSTRSPLAQRLFEIEGVTGVALDSASIAVSKSDERDWQLLKPAILGVIMEHFTAGKPVLLEEKGKAAADDDGAGDDAGEDSELVAEIKELIDTRIRPAAARDGGDVIFRGFEDGVVLLEFQGPAFSLTQGILNMLRHYVPEVVEVKDYRDAMPKPGLETPEAEAIQRLLEERVNPAVAAHGGHISLVDVRDETAYIRLEGGCQGCGMANVTLKQGVETEIKQVAPKITTVLDVTDHAGGTNPYYQPGKGGVSPF